MGSIRKMFIRCLSSMEFIPLQSEVIDKYIDKYNEVINNYLENCLRIFLKENRGTINEASI